MYGTLVLLVLGFTGGFYTAWKYKPQVTKYHEIIKPITVIKTRVLTKIKYKTRVETKIIYVPSEGSIEIKPKDPDKELEDVIEVKVKWYGLTFKPGFQIGLLDTSFGLDFKLAYMNRLGLNTGLLIFPRGAGAASLSPTAGFSYRLDRFRFIDNTEVMCVYSPLFLIPVNCGLRINL